MKKRDIFDNISPVDYRYWDKDIAQYLSENAFTRYKLLVEVALVKVLHRYGLCPQIAVDEIEAACAKVTTAEVYAEEKKIHHDIRALVNCIRSKVSDSTKPYVHMTATSYDIVDTANAMRYRDVTLKVLIPALLELEKTLIDITLREADTIQIGRTHGQHAVPITFGFALSGYVSRLGNSIERLKLLAEELPGKFSGAVGAYNASFLFFNDPEIFEREILDELGLLPSEHSTQIVPSEYLIRLFCEISIVAGIMANLADDMRHLQRTEINEVGEEFDEAQVGSSTMPQKRNPINFENIKSSWKIVMPRILTVFMDQISEHQRDLTNSASSRTYGEIIVYVVASAKRLARTMAKLKLDSAKLKDNLAMQKGLVLAEPLYLVLSSLGHPDAHEKVRMLTLQVEREGCTLQDAIVRDPEMQKYLARMTAQENKAVTSVFSYTGISAKKAKNIAEKWKKKLEL